MAKEPVHPEMGFRHGPAPDSAVRDQSSPLSLRLAFVGDLALGGDFIRRACPPGGSLTYPFAPLQDALSDVDVLLVNLEGPLSMDGPRRKGRSVLLHNDPAVLDWLASFPCCVCSLANNHTTDYGLESLERTRELLASRGIHFLGAGKDEIEANRELRLRVKGKTISVLAFTTDEVHVGSEIAGPSSPGCCGLPKAESAVARVAAAAAETDASLVLLHAGYEYFTFPTPEQLELARQLVSGGATMVVGHHPHVQQGLEVVDNAVICHSLGNLLLPEMLAENGRMQYRKPATKQFAILLANLAGRKVAHWRLLGGRCDRRYRLLPYTGIAADRFNDEIARLSKELDRPDYRAFWKRYAATRHQQLRREALRDAWGKLRLNGWRTLLQTFSMKDLLRSLKRLLSLTRSSPRP